MRFSTTVIQFFLIGQAFLAGTAFAADDAATYGSKSYPARFATGLLRTSTSQEFLRTAPRVSFAATKGATQVPGKFSLRGTVGPVEDQGQCGSCWDFALTSTLRGSWIAAGKDSGRLSFNYLLNCATTMAGCDGGDFSAADYLVSPKGAPAYGTDGRYTQTAGNCVTRPAVASAKSYKLLGSNLGANPDIPAPSFQDIAHVIGVLHLPVSIDIAVDDELQSYSGGVFNGCSTEKDPQLNHMVVVEGYSCESSVDAKGNCVFDAHGNLPPGVGTWIIRNSWGKVWGDDGYFTMKATDKSGRRCDNVASDALYYDVK